jgi:hypothetical protein
MNIPLITVSGNHLIENIGLNNLSGDQATGGTLISNSTDSIRSLIMRNVVATDKLTLNLTEGTQYVCLESNHIFGTDIKTFNEAELVIDVVKNTFKTNTMVAVRFFQPIGASLFLEALDDSTYIVNTITDNITSNSQITPSQTLGLGFLSSGTATQIAPNGFLRNRSIDPIQAFSAGSFLFQGVDSSRVQIEGCFDNIAIPLTDSFTLQNCDINIKKAGFAPNAAGLSEANNFTQVATFASVNIFNDP